jgi:hypothetical protein
VKPTHDRFGIMRPRGDETTGMFSPVECTHCGGVYDLGKVEVTARYTDCSMWKAPCCGLLVDDRPPGWGRGDIRRLDRD